MERVVHTVLRRALPQARPGLPGLPHSRGGLKGDDGGRPVWNAARWEVWSLPRAPRAFVLALICGYLAWVGVLASGFTAGVHDLALFAALLGCAAATVELTRHVSEPSGIVKGVYAVWELPVVIHLPPLYALAVPAIRLGLTQWRVRQAAPYRRAFSAAATGLAYGCASAVFRAMIPSGVAPRAFLWSDTAMWLLAAACCALVQWAISRALVAAAVRGSDPSADTLGAVLGKQSLQNDATELCAAILVSLAIGVSPLTLLVAFPMGTLLQRSFRHARLLHDARADAKTGLLNAATWEREATAEVARAVRTSSSLAVALLDLDRFKLINDTYGHLVGDQVLRRVAETMTGVLREYDLAGRFGGEEFAMLLPQTRAVDALRIAERVRAHIAQLAITAPGAQGSELVPVTVSIGVAALDGGSRRELDELMAAADAALYRAKASGRDQVQMISTSRGLSAHAGDFFATLDPPTGTAPRRGAAQDGDPGDVGDVGDDGDDGKASTAITSALVV